jgi:hypothetical protein
MKACNLFSGGLFCLACISLQAPAEAKVAAVSSDSEQGLRDADAGYWRAFNACDAAAMGSYLADDLEFYHDKSGLTRSRAGMVDATMKGICGNPNVQVRRAAETASVSYDPIPGYGGVLSGQHQFYMTEKGMPERLTGIAKFVMLWHFDRGHWQLARGFSLDHQPVAYRPPAPGVILDTAALQRYVGRYYMPSSGEVTITTEAGKLILVTDNLRLSFVAEATDHFFALERPLQLYFSGTVNGKAVGITVVENGAPVESGKRDGQ